MTQFKTQFKRLLLKLTENARVEATLVTIQGTSNILFVFSMDLSNAVPLRSAVSAERIA